MAQGREATAWAKRERGCRGSGGGHPCASGSAARCGRTTSTRGHAWTYFSNDRSRSRAYKWGGDGIAALCDDDQRLCFAIALRNGVDPTLEERRSGLTNAGVDNLYFLDSRFVAGIGAVNPTLTIIANALGVGDHFLERLGWDREFTR